VVMSGETGQVLLVGGMRGLVRVLLLVGGDVMRVVTSGLSRTGQFNGGRWRRWRNGRQRYWAASQRLSAATSGDY
jgi:hypothetical protein